MYSKSTIKKNRQTRVFRYFTKCSDKWRDRGLPFFWLWAMFLQFSSFVLLLYLNMIWPCIWTYTHFWSSCSKILNICALKTLQKYLPSTQKTVFLVKRPKWSPFYKSFSRLYQKWSPSCTFYFKYAD